MENSLGGVYLNPMTESTVGRHLTSLHFLLLGKALHIYYSQSSDFGLQTIPILSGSTNYWIRVCMIKYEDDAGKSIRLFNEIFVGR